MWRVLPCRRALLLCGVVAWVLAAAPVGADDAEDKAVAFVEKLGGKITRDDKAVTSLGEARRRTGRTCPDRLRT